MDFVITMEGLNNNLNYIKNLRANGSSAEIEQLNKLIGNGRNFYPYIDKNELAFAPSRFIGYQNNSLQKHAANDLKDGRLTNKVLAHVISPRLLPNARLDSLYEQYCVNKGIQPKAYKNRKYWFTPEAKEFIDNIEIKKINADNNINKDTITERENLVSSRVGQGKFRDQLIDEWEGCAITRCSQIELLIASHIKPWRECDNEERLDRFNGFLLTPNYDRLFDQGYISFEDNGAIKLSSALDKNNLKSLSINPDASIDLKEGNKKYLAWHRENLFID